MPNHATIQPHPSLQQTILRQMLSFLQEGSFKVGDRLPAERYLAEILGFSRGSIRKVIGLLANMGIVHSKQGAGTYITSLNMTPPSLSLLQNAEQSSSLFDQLLEFRSVIEPAIAAIAAEKCSPKNLDALKVIVCDQQKRMVMDEGDGNLDALFHLQIAKATGNILFVETIDRINNLYMEGRSDKLRDKEWRVFSVTSHLKIIDAIERKSPKDCHKEVIEHIKTVHETHSYSKKNKNFTKEQV